MTSPALQPADRSFGPDRWAPLRELAARPDDELADHLHLEAMPGFLLRRADSFASACFEAACMASATADGDLTPRQFGLLAALNRLGSVSQSELADVIRLDRSTLGEMLARMTERGLVRRRPSPRDRRSSEVTITAAGRRAVEAHSRAAVEAQLTLLDPLPDYLKPVFLACLELLVEGDPRHPGGPNR